MSKNKNNKSGKNQLELLNFSLFPFKNARQPYIILALIGFVFYINTIYNEFALDDGIIIHKNEFVMKGVSGIKDILTHDAYFSFYKQMNAKDQLAGGRYRPLSVVSFAIEQEIIGKHKKGIVEANSWDTNKNNKPELEEDINEDGLYNEYDTLVKGCSLRHFNNMLFYILSVLLMYALLKNYLFKKNHDIAFLAALIFCIHPIHTEVVANMKSRDEIFSILFIALTFIYTFKFTENYNLNTALKAAGLFFLALLSKEYAVTMLVLVPAAIYLFVPNIKWDKTTPLFVSMTIVLVGYLLLRFSIVVAKPDVPNTEILNNPYLLATHSQVLATKIFVWLKYLGLLFFPHPLSSDYSYNTIVYRSFASWDTWLSVFVHLSLVGLSIYLFIKKHPLAFALLFYFANLVMVGNLFFDIGATMGERLIYHSSFGFAIAIAWLLVEGLKKLIPQVKTQTTIMVGFAFIITVLCGFKTIERNKEWKNDITLFTTDVNTVPNSVMCLGNAGARWVDLSDRPENSLHAKEYRLKAVGYLKHALQLHPKYVNGYLNLGLAYFKLDEIAKAEEIWTTAKKLYPSNPYLISYYELLAGYYMNRAAKIGKAGKYAEAIQDMKKAVEYTPNNPEIWYNLGGASYMMKDFTNAKTYFEKCLALNPNHKLAQQGHASIPK